MSRGNMAVQQWVQVVRIICDMDEEGVGVVMSFSGLVVQGVEVTEFSSIYYLVELEVVRYHHIILD